MILINKPFKLVEYYPFLISLVSILVYFLLTGWQGYSFADESYLWYGSQRVLLGDVPILDFMSYDPGRYYLSAGFMSLLNSNGIIAQRLALTAIQFVGIYSALFIILSNLNSTKIKKFIFLVLCCAVLLGWMFPRHKLFDISISILLVLFLNFLIRKPNSKNFFWTGVFIGIVFFFGKNHALYGMIALALAIFWISITNRNLNFFKVGGPYLFLGLIIGLMPLIIMVGFLPGFGGAYINGIESILTTGKTNFNLPIPWPWVPEYSAISAGQSINKFLIGIGFVFLIIFIFISLIYVVYSRIYNKFISFGFVASLCVTIPYTHFALSRADISHLAQSIFPALIGIFIIIGSYNSKAKWLLIFLILAITTQLTLPILPCWNGECTPEIVYEDQLNVDKKTKLNIELIGELKAKYTMHGESYIVTPFQPGAYSIFNAKSPIWGIYVQHPQTINNQLNEISKIESSDPKFILINTKGVDGRADLSYVNTHPIVYAYIKNKFNKEEMALPEPTLELYIKKIKN